MARVTKGGIEGCAMARVTKGGIEGCAMARVTKGGIEGCAHTMRGSKSTRRPMTGGMASEW